MMEYPILVGFAANGDACKWGLTDLFEDCEKMLREAIDKRVPFDTKWCGCVKEIRSFRIISDGTTLTVMTHAEMDDLPELIDDAVYAIDADGIELTEEQIEECGDLWDMNMEVSTECGSESAIPLTTYEALMKELAKQEQENDDFLTGAFEEMKAIVRHILNEEV